MLNHLAISNIALISRLGVDFAAGFTALTGETGAGKSLLMDALGLALGSRADPTLIRHGESTADVTATFTPTLSTQLSAILEEQGLELEDGTLILRRQLKREGAASKAWVNGTPVAAGTLSQLAACLVDVHAQHSQQTLLMPAHQRDTFDALARLQPQRATVAQTYAAWQTALAHQQTLAAQCAQAHAEAEELNVQRENLTRLNYQPGEEESLANQRQKLLHFTQLQQALTAADDALSTEGATLTSLRVATRNLTAAAQFDSSLQPLATRLEASLTDLADAAHDIARATSALEAEGNLEAIDDRLHALKAAARKHQTIIENLPEILTTLTSQTTNLGALEATLQDAEKATLQAHTTFTNACATLTSARQQATTTITPQLQTALKNLHLPHAVLTISLQPVQPNSTGAESVEFLLSANPGSPAQPIAKVASGGELSRLMLALKQVLYQGLPAQTVVFDEIDTGLSGAAAAAVGRAMAQIGEYHQVLAITHHPQVAASASHHATISKQVENGSTSTTITTLENEPRIEELARLLSGNRITTQAREAAKSLLSEAA